MHGTVPASLSELHHERLIAWQIQSAQQCANVAVTVMLVMPRKAKMYALMPCTSVRPLRVGSRPALAAAELGSTDCTKAPDDTLNALAT